MPNLKQNPAYPIALLALLLGAVVGVAAAQEAELAIESESITEQGTLDPFAAAETDLQPIFDEAERLFRSFDQPDSVPLFDRLIARLEADHSRQPLAPELLTMLILSRSHRAETHFNLGENESAEADLRRILEIEPGWRMNPDLVSPKFVGLMDRLRDQMVGEVLVLAEPIDASVSLAGRPIEVVGQPVAVLAGSWTLQVTRPGFSSVEEEIQVAAGRSMTLDHVLERLSAVARVRVRPAGATVLVDGRPARVAARIEIPEATAEEDLAIEGLDPGTHVVQLQLAGYRPLELSLEVVELDDYRLAPAQLELMRGELRLSGLPEGARVTLDGEVASPRRSGETSASLLLPPGDHLVEVRQPGVGGFRSELSIADRQVLELPVELRPTLAFLGVLGSDRLTAGDLAGQLERQLGQLDEWIWIDHSIDAAAVLADLGLSVEEMRRIAELAGTTGAPEWAPVQGRFDADFDASLYLLAVLGDDLYATTADLWLWSPGPWPSPPTRSSLPIAGADELTRLAAAFDARPIPWRLHLGARFIDSEAAGGPLTTSLSAGGPASSAGLTVGDQVLELAGQPLATVAELLEGAAAQAGNNPSLRVGSSAVTREIQLQPELRPSVLSLTDPDLPDQVVAARLSLELLRPEGAVPRWLLELNQAALLLRARAYQDAVQLLRRIDAPAGPGLGRPMVDYWLGTTLLSIDPNGYADAARAALERALLEPEARLYHDDGPLLAPRARAWLAQLDRLRGN